jgi:site-specific DNA-methyltransferase (adenine-specific)
MDWVETHTLVPHPKNRNKHSKEQIERLAELIKYQGWRHPIIVSQLSGYVVAGHGRLSAAKLLHEPKVPVHVQEFTSQEQEYAFLVSDNAIASWAELDLSGIHADLPELQPFDIDLLGIKDFRFEPEERADEDSVPEISADAKSKQGDLYQLGVHRLLCGDSTDREQVERLMNSEKAVLWSSDPPYGINHVETSNEKEQSKGYSKIQNDELHDEELQDFIFKTIEAAKPHMREGFAFYMWHAMKMQSYFAAAAAAAGILFHRQIIWVKPSLVFGRGQYHWRHELCLMGWLKGNECPFYGERNQTSVWEVGRENDKIHPTQKPVALTEIPIKNHTKQGEIVIDQFLGSGSTLIACEKTNRKCFGMEIDPHYCDVIVERWEKYTGKKAELIGQA